MASFWRGRDAGDEVDDFDEYDPTPYGGGYDIHLTYGRPIPPSEDTCYPVSSSGGGGIDYERPHYSSGSQSSAYEADYDYGDRYGRPSARPQHPQPVYGCLPQKKADDLGYGRPRPKPDYSYGQNIEYGAEQGFGYGGRPKLGEAKDEYSAPYYGRKKEEEGKGSGYGGRPKREDEPSYGYDGGFVQDQPKHYGDQEGGQGYGYSSGKYQSGGGEYCYGGGEYRRSEEQGYGGSGYGRSGEQGYGGSGHQMTSKEYGYGEKPSHEYQKLSYYGADHGQGYGRPKYGDDSDGEEKKKHHHHHHHRNYADDE